MRISSRSFSSKFIFYLKNNLVDGKYYDLISFFLFVIYKEKKADPNIKIKKD